MTKPSLPELLHAAVTAVGGTERPGQVTMAEAVAEAIDDGSHLLIQAGTGTGKSLGYLVPALAQQLKRAADVCRGEDPYRMGAVSLAHNSPI